MIFGLQIEKNPAYHGLSTCNAFVFEDKAVAESWKDEVKGYYSTTRKVFDSEEAVITYLLEKRYPKQRANKIVHFSQPVA